MGETAVVMLLYIDAEVRERRPTGMRALLDAVAHGAALRLRPKMMTVLTIFAGLVPIFLTEGIGSDVMRRIALPMVGGMASTLLLTLLVLPALYALWVGRKFGRSETALDETPQQRLHDLTGEPS